MPSKSSEKPLAMQLMKTRLLGLVIFKYNVVCQGKCRVFLEPWSTQPYSQLCSEFCFVASLPRPLFL